MDELFKSFRVDYKLTDRIPYNKISDDIQNLEFIKEDGYLIGFTITLNKLLGESDGEKEVNDFANFLASLISIKSHRYVLPCRTNSEFTRIDGTKSISGDFTIRFNIAGAPVNLDIKNEILSLKSFSSHIYLHLKYLAKAIKFYHDESPDHALIEAFKLIENNYEFPDFDKYYALRNIAAHSPYDDYSYYGKKTMNSFKKYFGKEDFEYIKYEPTNNRIIINLESPKTQKKLNEIVMQLIDELKRFLKIS